MTARRRSRPLDPRPPAVLSNSPLACRCPWRLRGIAVSVSIKSRIVTVSGPRGQLVRNFKHAAIDLQLIDDALLMDMWFATKRQLSTLGSLKSHITNMMIGVVQVRHRLPACTPGAARGRSQTLRVSVSRGEVAGGSRVGMTRSRTGAVTSNGVHGVRGKGGARARAGCALRWSRNVTCRLVASGMRLMGHAERLHAR